MNQASNTGILFENIYFVTEVLYKFTIGKQRYWKGLGERAIRFYQLLFLKLFEDKYI